MNDDLERRLRDELRRGALPPAPDGLRERLAQLPSEAQASGLARFFSGLRLAALASAAAVAIAFVLVVRSLPAPTGTNPGPSFAGVSSAGPSATGSPIPTAEPTFGPASEPPAASSSPQPVLLSPAPGFTCASTTVLPATTGAVTQINDVRAATHPGYDRIVFQFVGSGLPKLTVARASPPFVEDASGRTVVVSGRAFLTLKLYDASGYPTYTGPNSIPAGYPSLTSLVNTGDYEGYVTWVAGLNGPACYRISTLTGPARIVLDIQAP
jgi:hypothetical protein